MTDPSRSVAAWLRGHHHSYRTFRTASMDWNEYGLRCRCGNEVLCESSPYEVR